MSFLKKVIAITKSEGAKLVAENSDWRVYNILT